ncbi:hypothetical protein IHQ71_04375 [Rhizobium sp. TH2]|uniref:hypothetical protein n=1 Tax=Rhizobium sp. TH2 TaxID=2775403 RepID=UPI0021579F3C|nr:hypothetical protein [Rhizobium sp. TH2]UVC09856.1 hypothetical protein IHQ71_04375 [Rhizobium sp. TH2]
MTKTTKTKSPAKAPTQTLVGVPKKRGLILTFNPATMEISLDGDKTRQAFGSDDDGFKDGLIEQLVQMTAVNGKINEKTLHFVAGAMMDISPRNATEGLLAAQTVANHVLAMKIARLAVTCDGIEKLQKLETMMTKMMRTTTAQMEALHKLRNGGKQKVKVEHIHIHEGAQAVIGDVTTGGR